MKPNNIIPILLIVIAACTPAEQKKPQAARSVLVKVEPVELVEYKVPVRATGLLATTTEMKLSFKTGGIISQIHVKEGRSVEKGDVLAELDLSEIRAQANQARIGLEKAQRDMTRAGNLYRDSVATLEQYQNARSAYELAESQKQIADFNLQHSRIKAPSNGKVQKILVESNELIGSGHPAILFASTENDWVVRAALTDKDVVRFSIGDSARIYMDAFPDSAFRAEVTELGTIADPVTGTYEAELLIIDSHQQFRTGFISRVEIYPTLISRSLVVPVESLQDASDHFAYVFVYKDGLAAKRNIRTGQILGNTVVVVEGLEKGEMVITEGAGYLKADMQVELVGQTEENKP